MKKKIYKEAIDALEGKATYWRKAARECRRQWTKELAEDNDLRAQELESAADFLRSLKEDK